MAPKTSILLQIELLTELSSTLFLEKRNSRQNWTFRCYNSRKTLTNIVKHIQQSPVVAKNILFSPLFLFVTRFPRTTTIQPYHPPLHTLYVTANIHFIWNHSKDRCPSRRIPDARPTATFLCGTRRKQRQRNEDASKKSVYVQLVDQRSALGIGDLSAPLRAYSKGNQTSDCMGWERFQRTAQSLNSLHAALRTVHTIMGQSRSLITGKTSNRSLPHWPMRRELR